MAKKWQELEFVDYKERQRRRRLKRRQVEQDEFTQQTKTRSNLTLVTIFFSLFLVITGSFVWVTVSERSLLEDAQSKKTISIVSFTGVAEDRADATEAWVAVKPGTQRVDRYQFRTGVQSSLNLETFDRVLVRLLERSEVLLSSMEIFNQNQGSKSNLYVENGTGVFDSRGSDGLLEVRSLDVIVYARPSLFKVHRTANGVDVRVSAGAVRFEWRDKSVILQSGESMSIQNGTLGEMVKFNPLTEVW